MKNSVDAMKGSSNKRIVIDLDRILEDYLVISVADTGPGVAPGFQNRLFQFGATTKTSGVGYGLWWTKLWLERIGGRIYYDQAYERGARFVISLPRKPIGQLQT
jgi:C4-dicarboxylate-specific signal transduction histidine kinase